MSMFLNLKGTSPLAQGHSRLVFQHPRAPEFLVKVIRPDVIDQRWGSGAAWYKRRRRFGRFISYARETREYIVGCLAKGVAPAFLQKVEGFVETDLGLGLVIKAVRSPCGDLAPNLGQLIDRGCFGDVEKAALADFGRQLMETDVIVSDLNLGNLVYTGDAATPGGFVLIDGLGDASLLPLKSMSRFVNRRSKRGRLRRLHERIERRRRKSSATRVDA